MSTLQTDDLRARVEHALQTSVGPALDLDGGGIEVLDISDGVVRIRMENVCNGCPSTIMTVIMGLEQELCRLVPEVEYIEAVY